VSRDSGTRHHGPVAARVLLLTRVGCHLCDDARAVVQRVCDDLGTAYEERDVDADPDLARRYGDMVPVTLVDGVQHDYWRVDPERLRVALTT
jgi:Glutaredoxin-like domain (DUF836)